MLLQLSCKHFSVPLQCQNKDNLKDLLANEEVRSRCTVFVMVFETISLDTSQNWKRRILFHYEIYSNLMIFMHIGV